MNGTDAQAQWVTAEELARAKRIVTEPSLLDGFREFAESEVTTKEWAVETIARAVREHEQQEADRRLPTAGEIQRVVAEAVARATPPAVPVGGLTTAQLINRSGWSERTIRRMCKKRQIPFTKIRGEYRFDPSDIEAALKKYKRL